jgi:hypothetical protein
MAQQVLVQLVDDLDGTSSNDVTTVRFGLDGVTYEIDLTGSNADRLRDTVADYVANARRTGGRVKRGARPANGTRSSAGREAAGIREWAQANGVEIAARGRIPGHVAESYREAQAGSTKSSTPKGRSRAKKA